MTPDQFVAKWRRAELKERSAAQEHWIDVCRMLDQPTPADADPTGEFYCFERGAEKSDGGDGWADVWFKDHFAVEYKRKRRDLEQAYAQLNLYRESLGNPPLLIVVDLDRFEVHTNFTGTAKRIFRFSLTDFASGKPVECRCDEATPPRHTAIEVLRYAFTSPETLKPTRTAQFITEEASSGFSKIAQSMRDRGVNPREAAHFLMKSLFCLFAEDISLLPESVFARILRNAKGDTARVAKSMRDLFEAMRDGGAFGADDIPWFNGGLFKDDVVIELTETELKDMRDAANLNWSQVEPSIFGTLFERSLDPDQRAQLGAHYTGREDIMLIVEPVVLRPMRRLWEAARAEVQPLVEQYEKAKTALASLPGKSKERTAHEKKLRAAVNKIDTIYQELLEAFHKVKILDPACGSGNFLYVALNELKNMEKQIILEAYSLGVGLTKLNPLVEPAQLYGIELNAYAHELAQVVVWIGYIQWHDRNGYGYPDKPILKSLDNIKCMDALLEHRADDQQSASHLTPATRRPVWPKSDFIIGNPPFLGGKKLREALGDKYVDTLFEVYDGDVAREADLSVYWHERSRALIEESEAKRAGMLATQGIRGGANQKTLKRILETGNIFDAWSDREWMLAGAAVHVSIVCQDNGSEQERRLDGSLVAAITGDLGSGDSADLSKVSRLAENSGLSFMGITPAGPFDIPDQTASEWLRKHNPNGRPNAEVLRPYVNGKDLMQRRSNRWIIDFGVDTEMAVAAGFEAPFEYVRNHVKLVREEGQRAEYRRDWWRFTRPRPEMRAALAPLRRYIATSMVAKHRVFCWLPVEALPANLLIVVAREDDYFFGVLHSVAHERWALRLGTQLEDRPRYTPTTSFETFPFPWPPRSAGASPATAVGAPPTAALKGGAGEAPAPNAGKVPALRNAIAAAAKELNDMREAWLNPPGETEAELKKRTLTNLYNKRPEWLHLAHLKLDRAVFDAYGWNDLDPADLYATLRPNQNETADHAATQQEAAEEEMLKRLLALNHARDGQ